jgi:hypothetical protein
MVVKPGFSTHPLTCASVAEKLMPVHKMIEKMMCFSHFMIGQLKRAKN